MKIEINLARNPFRNDTLFYVLAGILGATGLLGLAIESHSLYGALSARSQLNADIRISNARIRSDRESSARIAKSIDGKLLKARRTEAEAVMGLISRRTFDWDTLFEALEAVLPGGVRLTSIQPTFRSEQRTIALGGVAKSLADQNDFVVRLEQSELFSDVFVSSQTVEGSEVKFTITARYERPGVARATKS